MAKSKRHLSAEDADRFGFRWGPVDCYRACELPGKKKGGAGGYHCVEIETDHRKLSIYVSPTGRSVRVFEGRREWGPRMSDAELLAECRRRGIAP